MGRHEDLILEALAFGPTTAHGIAERLRGAYLDCADWTNVTVSRRLAKLEERGAIVRTGATVETPKGRAAEVWGLRRG